MEGWISLYRKFMNWQWYKDSNVKAVFIHLLLSANHKDEQWNNKIVKRGQLITSREHLSKATGLSIQQIRTCLTKLESTNEIEIHTTNKYTLITILKYDIYQKNIDEQSTSNSTDISTDTLTSKKDSISTNKNTLENIENKEKQKTDNKISTNKNNDTSTNKTTNKSTDTLTTNNNINNNILLNYTKLNLLFNYLIYKEQNFEKLEEKDRIAIIVILKRLDIYTTSINYIPEETLKELKIQYWTIVEIYLSPYKIYLNNLNRMDFLFRFLKTKQYVECNLEDKLTHFINYFIKSLREDFKSKYVD